MYAGAGLVGSAVGMTRACGSPLQASLEVVEPLSERRGLLNPLPVRLATGLELVELDEWRATAMTGDKHPRAST